MLLNLVKRYVDADVTTANGRALVEERYRSLRSQVPVVYLLGFVNMSAMELAATGRLRPGLNLPSFTALCGIIRLFQWFFLDRRVTLNVMVSRLEQTVLFAGVVCVAVSLRCSYLLEVGDAQSQMAVMLFGGLTAIGVAYGLTALPAAAKIPLILIIVPISVLALLSTEAKVAAAAFGLVVVAALTMRLLISQSRRFTYVVSSRSAIERERELVKDAHQEAVVAATTDFLTGLPNRRAFVAALDMIAVEDGPEASFTVAILDLDRFKIANDTFGHAIGDQLLKEVAARLLRTVGKSGLVARLGGDEFGILLPEVSRAKEARAFGRRILEGVNGPVFMEGRQLVASACCGLAVSRRRENKSPSRIMADADLALYQAKEDPAGKLAVFDLRMEAPRRRRAQIEAALSSPHDRGDFDLVFQPIFDLRTGAVIAHEALARWNHPELGAVPPSDFVPIAERLNVIDDINGQLMAMAFASAREWDPNIKLSFNLSAIQLCSAGTAKAVLGALKSAALSAERLQVEVTETALLADFERARESLTELRAAGATIVLDDFGAGYASIGYLRELRFDQIKLDGGIVTAAQHGVDGKRLLRAVIGLCDILGVSTIAEHVESPDLLKLVIDLGCSCAQGFWLMPPVSKEELRASTMREFPGGLGQNREAA